MIDKSVGKINVINVSGFVLKTKYDTVGSLKKKIIMLKLLKKKVKYLVFF